ncbi:hypothetical protein D3C80_1479910 [compost metagenome]
MAAALFDMPDGNSGRQALPIQPVFERNRELRLGGVGSRGNTMRFVIRCQILLRIARFREGIQHFVQHELLFHLVVETLKNVFVLFTWIIPLSDVFGERFVDLGQYLLFQSFLGDVPGQGVDAERHISERIGYPNAAFDALHLELLFLNALREVLVGVQRSGRVPEGQNQLGG